MVTSTSPFEPIPVLSPELLDRLKKRVEKTLACIIRKNGHTRYVRESPVFSDFCRALDVVGDTSEAVLDEVLMKTFRETIPLTNYDSCEPFVDRLVVPDPKEDNVKDMFSPGLPHFIAMSSGTSGKKAKMFAKYRHPPGSLEDVDEHANPVSDNGGKNCIVYSLLYREILKVMNDEDTIVGQIPVTALSSGVIRMANGMDVHKDPWIIPLTAPRATSPLAVSFIGNYRSFLLMHALFALADPQLETINTLFGNTFVDMIRRMEEEWDTLVDSIETGVPPNWEGTDEVRQYLEPNFVAKPERAAYLRAVGKATDEPGWLKKLWPRLRVVIGIASGAFAVIVSKVRHYLGPDVHMTSLGFTASECYVGTAWGPRGICLFKATNDDIIEYLDMSKSEAASNLVFAHEVQAGNRYEVIVTTRDGLWRYRLGDVVEIAGFDPMDGTPILCFVERRAASIRLPNVSISEETLTHAISSVQDALGRITEYTVIVDDQKMPPSLAFLIEIDGTLPESAREAVDQITAVLRLSNDVVATAFDTGRLAPPSVMVLKAGTFGEYRALKVQATGIGAGQVKVPVVLWDRDVWEWILQRVDKVVGRD